MAAQGSEKKFSICDRCFASVPTAMPTCPECGAPMHGPVNPSEEGDAQVYHELARANLLRMRGDFAAAEAECLKILRRLPNNASAHTLLGDIYAEKGDMEQALQWYELSADLVSDPAVTDKITSTRRRISEREQAKTATELGLPAERSQKAKFVFMILVPVLVVFIAAYALGRKQGQEGHAITFPSKVVPPISAPERDPANSPDAKNGSETQSQTSAGSDVVLLQRIKSATADGGNVLMVMQDPRTKDLTVGYLVEEDRQVRPMGARLASLALDTVPDALLITVRAIRGGNLVYIANVHRSRLNETKQATWQNDNRDNADAWIDYVLENEWSTIPKSQSENGTTNKGLLDPSAEPTEGAHLNTSGQTNTGGGAGEAPSTPTSQGAGKAESEQPSTEGTKTQTQGGSGG